jgi:hypothetical protein
MNGTAAFNYPQSRLIGNAETRSLTSTKWMNAEMRALSIKQSWVHAIVRLAAAA